MVYTWIILIVPAVLLLGIVGTMLLFRKKCIASAIFFVLAIGLNLTAESIPLNVFCGHGEEGSFSVMTYNIHGHGAYMMSHLEQPREMADFILDQEADIVVLQECDKDSCSALLNMLTEKYEYQHTMVGKFMNVMLSRYPLGDKSELLLRKNAEIFDEHKEIALVDSVRGLYARKQIMLVNADVKGRTVKIIGSHFASNKLFALKGESNRERTESFLKNMGLGGAQREIEAYCVRDTVDSCRNVGVPAIVCGDLNDFSGSKTLRILQKDGALSNCWWERGNGLGLTFHNHGWMHFRLDHILHTEDLRCTSVRVVKQDFSDHDALVANFVFK